MILRRKIILTTALAAMAVLLLIIVLGDNGLLELNRLHTTHQVLADENAVLTRENMQLYRTIDRLQNDPAYVENVARRELGMIRADELIFQFQAPGASGKPK